MPLYRERKTFYAKGSLTHSLTHQETSPSDSLHEKCGIIGAFTLHPEAARLCYFGLWALQHRGQEASGICSANGKSLQIHKGEGLVAHVYQEKNLVSLEGCAAIGHNRYGTSGGKGGAHAQPVWEKGEKVALAHNGNLPSTKALESFLEEHGISFVDLNDSEMMQKALEYYLATGISIEEAVKKSFPLFTGAFCLVILTKDKLVAVRDAKGVRPLSLGKLPKEEGYVVASETCALDTVGARFVRDIRPGEMVVIDREGLHTSKLAKGEQKLDIFEFIYFARPDSMLLGKSVNEVRRALGRELAREFPLKADVVIPVPDSAIPAAIGYSEESGIPFDHGFVKNRYIHRTFIRPDQSLRERDVSLKLNPLPCVLKGKRVVVIDDSIVRGTTSKKLVGLLKKAGAKKVYLLVSSPPVTYPDFYGIDTPTQNSLLAANHSIPAMKKYIGADKLGFLSLNGTLTSTGLPKEVFSLACFTGEYPIDILERKKEIR